MYIEKVEEHYTEHTKKVEHTRTVNGKTETYYTEETYWTWDYKGRESLTCKEVSFLGVVFDAKKISFPSEQYIDTIKVSSRVRYKYYGVATKFTGTIFTELRKGTIMDNTAFYEGKTIEETVDYLESDIPLIVFWAVWAILMAACLYGFFYIDNRWLE